MLRACRGQGGSAIGYLHICGGIGDLSVEEHVLESLSIAFFCALCKCLWSAFSNKLPS